jgi:hypothetical protein
VLTIHEGIIKLREMLGEVTLDAQRFDDGVFVCGRRVRTRLRAVTKEIKIIKRAIIDIQKQRAE